jgi:hypothetical protein
MVGAAVMETEVLSATRLAVTIPLGMADGTYDVTVTNPDGKSAVLSDALVIRDPVYYVYMPMITKEP